MLVTLRETNIASENRPSQKKIHLLTIAFQVLSWSISVCDHKLWGLEFISNDFLGQKQRMRFDRLGGSYPRIWFVLI